MTDKLNALVGKPYDADNYHCWHFIEAVMDVPTLIEVHADTANDDVDKYIGLFTEIEQPINGCIVLIGESHVGVWYNGGIYHNDTHGVRYEPKRTLKFRYKTFKYYEVKQ